MWLGITLKMWWELIPIIWEFIPRKGLGAYTNNVVGSLTNYVVGSLYQQSSWELTPTMWLGEGAYTNNVVGSLYQRCSWELNQ